MGAWGLAIEKNDTYADVYADFFDLYNNGEDVDQISKQLLSKYQATIDLPEDANNFWFALIKAQWECKQVDPQLFERVKAIITSGADLEFWRQLEATEQQLAIRAAYLDKFLAELKTERDKPKARRKKALRKPVFEKGDCITFMLNNGNYGGAVILAADHVKVTAYNLVAATRINQPNKPIITDFENAELLIANHGAWKDHAYLGWTTVGDYKYIAHRLEKIGTIDVQTEYAIDTMVVHLLRNFEVAAIDSANNQFESELTKPRPQTRQTIKQLTQR